MITTCKQLRDGQELYARFHTNDEEPVRGEKHPAGTVECKFTEKPTKDDKDAAQEWVEKQFEATGILVKRPELKGKIKFHW